MCSPVDFLRRLASITPPPRVNLLRFHGVFAPNSRFRPRITPTPDAPAQPSQPPPSPRQGAFDFVAALLGALATKVTSRLSWADLLQRTFRTDVLLCPRCEGRMRVLAFTTDATVAQEILARLGLAAPRPLRPLAAGPPQLGLAFPN